MLIERRSESEMGLWRRVAVHECLRLYSLLTYARKNHRVFYVPFSNVGRREGHS